MFISINVRVIYDFYFYFFSILHPFMFACNFFTFVSCLTYCHILQTSVFSNRYFYISLRHIYLFLCLMPLVQILFRLHYYFYSTASDKVRSSPQKLVPLIKTKSTLMYNFLFFSLDFNS